MFMIGAYYVYNLLERADYFCFKPSRVGFETLYMLILVVFIVIKSSIAAKIKQIKRDTLID